MSNVVSSREFWNRKVDSVFTRFYYNNNVNEFVDNLARLGYNKEQVEGILNEWMNNDG